jgi:hypothetical protein
MKRLALLLVGAVLSFPSAMLAQAAGTMAAPQTAQTGKMAKADVHPEIRAAMQHLRQAKEILVQKAAHDFEGHKKEAIESIDHAIDHLQQALQADKP